jgi:chemotaxis response regulator CheB
VLAHASARSHADATGTPTTRDELRSQPQGAAADGNRDIVAIGASAGGVRALLQLAAGFQRDLPASVLVTLHLSNQGPTGERGE